MKMILSELTSPLGAMLLATDEHGHVRALEFAERRSRLHRNLREQYGTYELIAGPAPTYGAIGKAMSINDWRAAVDAGSAVVANPIAIIVPCHRVLGKGGDLAATHAIARGGYARHRVFFRDEATAIAAGYRPCAVCLPEKYAAWKAKQAGKK